MKKLKKLVEHPQPLFNVWHALYRAFFSPRLYIDVHKRWQGLGLKYLLLVVMILSIPFSLRTMIDFNRYFNQKVMAPIRSLPVLYIKQGNVLSSQKNPYFGRDPQGNIISIVDTSNQIYQFSPQYPDLTILINQQQIQVKFPMYRGFNQAANELLKELTPVVYTESLTGLSDGLFLGSEWSKGKNITYLKRTFTVVIYPCVIVGFYFLLAMLLVVLAILGQMVARMIFNVHLTYMQAMRLSAVAATPELLLFFYLATTNTQWIHSNYILGGIFAFYYSGALFFIRRETRRVVRR